MLDVLSGGCIGRVDVGDIQLDLGITTSKKCVHWVVFWHFVGGGHVDDDDGAERTSGSDWSPVSH